MVGTEHMFKFATFFPVKVATVEVVPTHAGVVTEVAPLAMLVYDAQPKLTMLPVMQSSWEE